MRTPQLERISDYPGHWARQRPDDEAMVSQSTSLNWEQFAGQVDRCARALLALGVERGDRVALLSVPRPEYLVVFMAAARVGAIWQGLNPRHTLAELQYLVGDSRPRVLLGIEAFEGRNFVPDLEQLAAETDSITCLYVIDGGGLDGGLEAFFSLGNAVDDGELMAATETVESTDPCLVVYTSGSTGSPKGALLTHGGIVATGREQCERWWAEPFRILNNLPISHIGGAVQLSAQAIVAGGASILMERFDPGEIVRLAKACNITVLHQVPMMYRKIVECPEYQEAGLPSVQTVIWSGAPSPPALIRRYREITDQLFTSYGSTEQGGETLYTPPYSDDETLSSFVGLPPTGIDVRIDPETSEIQARGKAIMVGYLNRPEATTEAFTDDGWFRTGDCGEIDEATGYWRITGRITEMYKSGGYNVYPREVELVLESHPAVAMSAVFGVADETYGEKGVAYLLLAPGAQVAEGELKAHCRQQLANYKIPKVFSIREELPMLPIGKVDKAGLKQSHPSS